MGHVQHLVADQLNKIGYSFGTFIAKAKSITKIIENFIYMSVKTSTWIRWEYDISCCSKQHTRQQSNHCGCTHKLTMYVQYCIEIYFQNRHITHASQRVNCYVRICGNYKHIFVLLCYLKWDFDFELLIISMCSAVN